MDPSDFLDLADDLLDVVSDARYRTSVSRAYYGAFHVARQLVETQGVVLPKDAESHNKTQRCLEHCGDEDVRSAASRLASLRTDRNIADYRLDDRRFTNKKNVQLRIRIAREIVSQLAACDTEPLRSTVHKGVRTYAANVLRLPVT